LTERNSTQLQSSKLITDQLGIVCFLLTRSATRKNIALANVRLWIEPPILLNQIAYYFDSRGLPAAYMTWAWLSEDVEERLITDKNFLLHISEWNEGRRLWVMDIVTLNDNGTTLLRRMLRDVASKAKGYSWVRRGPDGSVRKVVMSKGSTPRRPVTQDER
jgi:cytolysin-activating lysine-acyltransferase